MDYLDICDKGVFTKVHEFLTCLIICPVTSVSVERLFLTMKRVHTASRKSMSMKRLSHLCMLSFEREITQSLEDNPIRVINMLKAMKSNSYRHSSHIITLFSCIVPVPVCILFINYRLNYII